LRVDGLFRPLAGAQVLRFVTEPNQAVGHAPWGLPPDSAVLAGGVAHDIREGTALPDLDDRPVVALVRGAQRYAWVQKALAALVERRPDLVVVELGWPGPDRLPGAAVVHAYGASAASARAVDALLANGSR
jgi:beta-N-acetylhexosaminidase